MKRHLSRALVLCLALLLTAALAAIPAAAAELSGPPAPPLVMLALQQAQLTGADGAANDYFGYEVALSGGTALVTAPSDDVGGNIDQGSVYVFVRSGSIWSQQQKLTAADGAANDEFGHGVAIDGDTALVTAPSDDVGGNIDQGSVYVFVRSGGIWSQQQKLTAADGAAYDSFGYAAVVLDGETALVGVCEDDVGANHDQGSAYVFVRSGSTWSQQALLTAADGAANDNFGCSVALDGGSALVGASWDDVGSNIEQGSAYVFVRSGSTWSQQALLTAADGAANDNFGCSVALDEDSALIGARYDDVGGNIDQGSVYVFGRSGGIWSEQQKLTAADGAASDYFGAPVVLDGETALIGVHEDDIGENIGQGSVYVLVRSGSIWSQQQKLTAAAGAANDAFGVWAALDGGSALVGACGDDVGSAINQGSAYVFALDMSAPVTSAVLSPLPNGAGWNRVAVTVTLSATDDVSGVDKTWYRLGDAGDYSIYDAAAQPVAASNGVTNVWFYSRDAAGNVETAKSLAVRIDTTRPVTKALAKATVRRGRKVTLRLRVDDAVSPEAAVTVKIYKGAALKKTLVLGLQTTNTEIRYAYTCSLARGTYSWKVYATDLAGNRQGTIGYKTLTVK